MTDKKTILVVTRNLPPVHGGMERLNHVLLAGLSAEYEVVVVAPKGAKNAGHPRVEYTESRFSNVYLFLISATLIGLFRLPIKRGGIYAIIATSGLMAPTGKLLSLRYRSNLITFVHGLDLVADSVVYKRAFLPFVRMSDAIVANSKNTARLAVDAGVNRTLVTVANPCVEAPVPRSNNNAETDLAYLQGRPVILSVGRVVKRKGLIQFIEKSMPTLVRHFPQLMLVIVGGVPDKSLNRDYGLKSLIEESIKNNGLENNITWHGAASDDFVTAAYKLADVFIFPLVPTRKDVEGFGIVALEAATFGLKTVAFDEGGVADAVLNGVTGHLIKSGDYEAFTEKVAAILEGEDKNDVSGWDGFLKKFTPSAYTENICKVINEANQ